MPKGPRGEKRPADVVSNAIKVARLAVGDETETLKDGKSAAAQELGSKGGRARMRKLSPERRAEIAKKAAEKRWKK
ncbi:MAG: hypothetical protein NW206_06145 [Hyphomonadaceae bacterium]|nr:hypothetical protein [Hyphomonadaceae bacterium]